MFHILVDFGVPYTYISLKECRNFPGKKHVITEPGAVFTKLLVNILHLLCSKQSSSNKQLRFSVEGFDKNTNLLIDSHFIKNNHLAIWPMVSNQEKQSNITRRTHWAHSIYQALCFPTLSHNPHKPAKYNSKKETQMYLLKIIQLINCQIRNQNQDLWLQSPVLSTLHQVIFTTLDWKSDLSLTRPVCLS